jgi:altronate dehydratase
MGQPHPGYPWAYPDVVGRVLAATGETTIEQAGWDLFRLILDTASGRTKPWAERWGISNALALFNQAPVK